MPGYLTTPSSYAAGIANVPSGNISSSTLQGAINELDTEKTTSAYVDGEISTVNSSISSLDSQLQIDISDAIDSITGDSEQLIVASELFS